MESVGHELGNSKSQCYMKQLKNEQLEEALGLKEAEIAHIKASAEEMIKELEQYKQLYHEKMAELKDVTLSSGKYTF